jgi:hypothetical protein
MPPDTTGDLADIVITDDPIGGIGTGDITAGTGIKKLARKDSRSVD